MKTLPIALAGLAALTVAALAAPGDFGNDVSSPQAGVLCDGAGQWCADATGVSVSWTEHIFGAAAAGRLVGAAPTQFGFANQVTCDLDSQTCSGGDGTAAEMMTKALFAQ